MRGLESISELILRENLRREEWVLQNAALQLTEPDFRESQDRFACMGKRIERISNKVFGASCGTGTVATGVLSMKAPEIGAGFPIASGVLTGLFLLSWGVKYVYSKPFHFMVKNSIVEHQTSVGEILEVAGNAFVGLRMCGYPSSLSERHLLTVDEKMEGDLKGLKIMISGKEVPLEMAEVLREIERLLPPHETNNYLLISKISRLLNGRFHQDMVYQAQRYLRANPHHLSRVRAQRVVCTNVEQDSFIGTEVVRGVPSIEVEVKKGEVILQSQQCYKLADQQSLLEEPIELFVQVKHKLVANESSYRFLVRKRRE